MTTTSIRRSVDKTLLRWQARLDTPWAERLLPWMFAGALFAFLALLAGAQYRSTGGAQLAPALQGAWLIANGAEPVLTVSTEAHLLASQLSLIFYPVAWATALLPPTGTLIVVQAAALALGIVPLWRIARRSASLRVGGAATLAAVYCLYPTVHNLNLSGFNPEVFALPALLGASYFGLEGQRRWFWVCVVVVLASRADLGLAVAGLGLVLVLTGRASLGKWAALAGLGWTLLSIFVLQPWVGDGSLPHLEAFAAYGDTPWGVVWGMVTNPGDLLADLGRERSFNLFVVLLGPVLFLPVLAPRILVGVLPLQGLYLLADVPEDALFGPLSVPAISFVFVATAFALARIGRVGVEKIRVDPRLLVALLLAGCAFFIQDAASSPYRQPWDWGGRDAETRVRIDAAAVVPEGAAVRASSTLLALVAERPELFALDPDDGPDARGAVDGVDVVMVDDAALAEWTPVQRRILEGGLDALGFEVIFDHGEVTVWMSDDNRN
ncbi:MAG: DUF2079 domain-containing protein [Acidimicrobiia bacterium]|nr:DUF2079 domain-containing protein [Acidimicrobiia bacterium]